MCVRSLRASESEELRSCFSAANEESCARASERPKQNRKAVRLCARLRAQTTHMLADRSAAFQFLMREPVSDAPTITRAFTARWPATSRPLRRACCCCCCLPAFWQRLAEPRKPVVHARAPRSKNSRSLLLVSLVAPLTHLGSDGGGAELAQALATLRPARFDQAHSRKHALTRQGNRFMYRARARASASAISAS